uniref:Integrase, catalytic region, zinc finger, CCHC-type, peptidase aspartic, catalytic n=1 Tax=Tanacetum cinerariifolium TaxID=118510 RepID=A0A6L2LR64_TANCI|nr:hypothetical protein [Tanacetum cinerariifolium]
MADENILALAPTRFDDQILPFHAWVPIGKSNFVLALQKKQKNPIFQISVDILQNINFFRAFTASASITPIDQAHQFVSPSSSDAIIDFVNELGYTEVIHFVSRMAMNKLYQPWRAILSMINQCLTCKTFRLGNLKFVPKGKANEVFGMPIPNELISNNIRNVLYYNTYLEMVAKHDQKIVAKKEGKKKSTTAKQLKSKHVKEKSSKPALAPKPKSQAYVGGVAIREPVAEVTQPLPVVEGKAMKEASTRPYVQPHDDASANIVHESPSPADAETCADTDKTNHGGDTEILQIDEDQGKDLDNQVNLEEKTVELDQCQAGSDPGKTPESRPLLEQEFIEEDHAGPDPGVSRVALAGPNPEPTHKDCMANVYPDVHGSLKLPVDEHIILKKPLSSSMALSSMNNLDDAYTFEDQFLDDKSTEDEPSKLNMDSEVVSMVRVLIHHASSLVPPLSIPIIDLSPPKPVSFTTQEPIFIATTTTTLPLLPPLLQQSTSDSELAARVITLEQKLTAFEQKSKTLYNTTQNLRSRVFTLELQDLPYKIDQTINESGSYKSLLEHVSLYEALETSMELANRDEFLAKKDKSCKRYHDDQEPPLPPPNSYLSKKRRHDSGSSGSTFTLSDTQETPSSSSKQKSTSYFKQLIEGVPITDNVNVLDFEDTDIAHLSKLKTRPDWMKPVPEEDRLATLESDWMEECHLLLTDQVDLANPKGHQIVPDMRKPLPLEGPPGQVSIQSQYFFNKDLEYLVSGDKGRRSALSISKLKVAHYLDFVLEELVSSLWIESKREYDISAAYDISHWWFKRKEFYITRPDAPSDHSKVISHMRILSVISLRTYKRYENTFLKEIVLRRADYKEYKISEADFKNLHPNDFEDLYLLHLQGQLNHLSADDKVHLFNAVNIWIRNIIIRKHVEDLQLGIEISKPRAVIYKDRNDQKNMIRETKVYKFSDGMLNRILKKLDHMVKDFRLFKYNLGMTTQIWSEDDRMRSKEFMEVIEHKLKMRRIFKSLKSFVGGRLRDVDYRLIQRTE